MTFTKRFLNYKVLTVVFLFFSLVGSVYLVQLVQENRSDAKAGKTYDQKRKEEQDAKNKKKQEEQDKANDNLKSKYGSKAKCLEEKSEKTCSEAFDPPKNDKAAELPAGSKAACDAAGGAWCGTCGGFCISMGGGGSCDQAGIDKCNEYPQRGGSYTTQQDATHKYRCGCSGGTYWFDKPGVCNFSGGKAESVTIEASGAYNNEYSGYKGTDNDGLCHIVSFTSPGKKNTYYCKNKFYGQDDLSTGCQEVASVDLSCFCGTVQIDSGNGFESKTMKCGCGEKKNEEETPTNTPPLTTITVTSTPTNTPTAKPTITNTPTPTSTGTVTPTNTPTNTPTPTNTLTPTPTPTGVWNSPTPTPTRVYVTSGPSPTRIILPNSGVEFPIQVLTIAGVITTLVGFLILL